LGERLKNLQPLIEELLPFKPNFEQLEVIGSNSTKLVEKQRAKTADNISINQKNELTSSNTWINDDILKNAKENADLNNINKNPYILDDIDEANDPLSAYNDVIEQPINVPCIIFSGQIAQWTGNNTENTDIVAIESRLNFETKAGKRVSAVFEIVNIGSTTIYYDWVKIPDDNPFEIVNSKTQRFYFDTRRSVILPGDVLKLHIVFKSVKGGIYTEKWEFFTRPTLLGGASLVLTLRGVAMEEDKFKKSRALIERKLFINEADIIAKNIVEIILSGVRTPERCSSPQNAYVTEEDIFVANNPKFFYDHETVRSLKQLYIELYSPEIVEPNEAIETSPIDIKEWNYSIDDFKEEIMNLDNEMDQRKQDLLFKLNSLISNLSFSAYKPTTSQMSSICYSLLCQSVDQITTEFLNIKKNLNLPITLTDEVFPNTDEFNKRYEEWKKEFEIFKKIEDEKKNRVEKGKEKGKKVKLEDKKDTDKKKEVTFNIKKSKSSSYIINYYSISF
jgi:hypothetical protein